MQLTSRKTLSMEKRCKIVLFLLFFAWQLIASATINSYFESIKSEPTALYAFLMRMPKGGELHYHLAGGAEPETMLALAAKGDYCLNKQTFALAKKTEPCLGVKAEKLIDQPSLYTQTIRAWSMQDFVPDKESGHDHFFATFYKFLPIIVDFSPEILAEVMRRAANQHELYLEIMVAPDDSQSKTFARQASTSSDFTAIKQQLFADKAFQDNIQHTVSRATQLLQQARQKLGCFRQPVQEVCNLTVKFQYYVLREQPLEKVFAQALNGFAAASRSKDIVAVNLVQPEDGIIALRDYSKQMEIFDFLHQLYPKVHIALHAGELAPDRVASEDLRFHIHDAIIRGHAERIGHGVDIAFENNAEELLRDMAKKRIAVEINLTSNNKILNVSGKNHPLTFYLENKVPVVLSTDDEGILRTDLTRQYFDAVVNHGIDYSTLKMINRNALTYSFLTGKSLWADAAKAERVSACKDLNSATCQQFVAENEKAQLQRQLEKQLIAFEHAECLLSARN
jgi:adenosine deaminase